MLQQEIFDTVARHLLTQKRRALQANNRTCAYRAPNGLKCAIGCLFTDDEYTPAMEDRAIAQLWHNMLLPERLVPYTSLLARLQDVHDHREPKIWRDALEDVADLFKLSKEVLNVCS
jgi:hypothetical protein